MSCRFAASVIAFVCCVAGSCSYAVAAPAKACDVINQQTASAIFGAAVGAGAEDLNNPAGTECRFNRASGNGSVYAGWVDAGVLGPNPGPMLKTYLQRPDRQVEAVPEFGQNSYYVASDADSSVNILYHGKIIMIGAAGSTNPGLKAAVLAVAKQLMAKL